MLLGEISFLYCCCCADFVGLSANERLGSGRFEDFRGGVMDLCAVRACTSTFFGWRGFGGGRSIYAAGARSV